VTIHTLTHCLRLIKRECSCSVLAGVESLAAIRRVIYMALVGGRVSAMPRASLCLVITSDTFARCASDKRAPGLSA
jgi:hypothetical protein